MSINSNGRTDDASMTAPRGRRDPSPRRMESPAGSQPISRTPTPDQILFIALSAGSLAHVATPELGVHHPDPDNQMLFRPEILRCADQLKRDFGTLWGLRDFPVVGWPEAVHEKLLYIYQRFRVMWERFDGWHEAYGRPEFAPVVAYTLAKPLPMPSDDEDEPTEPVVSFEANEDSDQTKRMREDEIVRRAQKKSYTGEAADRMFSPFEDEEMMLEIGIAAQNLVTLVWNECSPAWSSPEDEVALPNAPFKENTQPEANGRAPEDVAPTSPADRPELVTATPPGNGTATTNGRAPEAVIVMGIPFAVQRTHPLLKVPTGRVYVRDKDDLGEEPVDLDDCRVYKLADPGIDGGKKYLNVYYTKDLRWIQHVAPVPFDDSQEVWSEMLAEITPHQAACLIAEWTDGYLPQELKPYDESATPPTTNGRAPEAPAELVATPPENSTSETTHPSPPVVLNGPDDEVIVWGKRVPPLTPTQYRVVQALVDAYASGERLSKTQLEIRTKDARGSECDPLGILRRLREDPVWNPVISMAGKACRGYSLNPRPHTPTHKNTHKSLENHPRQHTGG